MSICGPHGVTTGQFVRSKWSLKYVTRSDDDPSHVACRAEATLTTVLGFSLDVDGELCNHTGVCTQRNGGDNVLTENPGKYRRSPETTSEGALRVLGIGRGVDEADCRRTALEACNEAVDYAYGSIGAARLPTSVCTAAADHTKCSAAPDSGGGDG